MNFFILVPQPNRLALTGVNVKNLTYERILQTKGKKSCPAQGLIFISLQL